MYTGAHPERVDRPVEIGGEPLDQAAAGRGVAAFDRRLATLQREHLAPAHVPAPVGNDCAAELQALGRVYSADPRRPDPTPAKIRCSSTASQFTQDAMSADADRLLELRHALTAWRGRALVVQGAQDPFGTAFPDADVQQYPRTQVPRLVVPHAGHLTWVGHPELITRIGAFLLA